MKAEIISIGTELLLGNITDTNATYLTQRLAGLGLDCYYVSQVGDNQARIEEVLHRAFDRSDLTITTGGLGPTGDDLTRESIAAMLGETPYVVPQLAEHLQAYFARRGLTMPDRNLKQATLIPSATTLRNPVGTAPGWLVTRNQHGTAHHIISMPGVPYEMRRMWQDEVEPWLRPMCDATLVSRTLKIIGMGESAVDEAVSDLTNRSNPTVAPYAKGDGVHLRISAKAPTRGEATELIEPVEQQIRERLGDAVYGADEESPGEVVGNLLASSHIKIVILEVGAGAAGSISVPLAGYEGLVGAISVPDCAALGRLLPAVQTPGSLAVVASSLLRSVRADVVLAVGVSQAAGSAAHAVQADAEIALVAARAGDANDTVTLKSQWNTSANEVSRLVGLGALNVLRKWLMKNRRRLV